MTQEPAGLVLIVEDEAVIADLQRMYLTREGFTVHIEPTGQGGLDAARSLRPVAIVLDIRLPDIDGMSVCRTLRAEGDQTPIVFVTARDDEVDRIVGLEFGGDDYITKPFSPREMVARIRAVLRRARPAPSGPLIFGPLRIDPAGRHALVDDVEISLTATEFDLLAFLAGQPGQVFSREQLLAHVWGYEGMGSRTVDVHVAQLRSKLGEASPIRTVRGVGYAVERR